MGSESCILERIWHVGPQAVLYAIQIIPVTLAHVSWSWWLLSKSRGSKKATCRSLWHYLTRVLLELLPKYRERVALKRSTRIAADWIVSQQIFAVKCMNSCAQNCYISKVRLSYIMLTYQKTLLNFWLTRTLWCFLKVLSANLLVCSPTRRYPPTGKLASESMITKDWLLLEPSERGFRSLDIKAVPVIAKVILSLSSSYSLELFTRRRLILLVFTEG